MLCWFQNTGRRIFWQTWPDGEILRQLCRQKDIELLEGHAMPDHIHMLLSVPPKYAIAFAIGYLKGKSAVRVHRDLLRTQGTLFGRASGHAVTA